MIVHILHTRLAYYMFRTVGLLYVSACRYRSCDYSHMKYFPSRGIYDAFEEVMLRVENIASEGFAAYVHELVVRPSPPRSLGSALAPPHSHSAALSLRALAVGLTQLRSRSAALLLGRALSASLTHQSFWSVTLSLSSTLARPRSCTSLARWVRVRPALLLGSELDG